MKIVQITNFKVSGVWEPITLPPEFEGHIGTLYQDVTEHPLRDQITIGWRYEGGDFLAPLDTSPQFGRIITTLAYRSRFTFAEKTAITYAAKQNTLTGASVKSTLDDIQAAAYVNLDKAETIAGTNNLETATLIGVGRATEILSSPVYSAELPSKLREYFGLPAIPTTKEELVNSGKGYTTTGEFFLDNPEYKV